MVMVYFRKPYIGGDLHIAMADVGKERDVAKADTSPRTSEQRGEEVEGPPPIRTVT